MPSVRSAAPYVDFLILADRAEAVNGKLYLMGGCFDQVTATALPMAYQASVAVRIVLPANDPRSDHSIEFTITGPGSPQMSTRGLRFVRQSDAPPHTAQAVLAAQTLITLEQAGEYVITAVVDGRKSASKRFEFRVVDAQQSTP